MTIKIGTPFVAEGATREEVTLQITQTLLGLADEKGRSHET